MAVDITQINALTPALVRAYYTDHLAHLNEEHLRDVAFILDFEISRFSRTEKSIQFRMSHNGTTVEIAAERGLHLIEITRINSRGRRGKTLAFASYINFAEAVMLFRRYFCRGCQITMQSPEKLAIYPREQWFEVVLEANRLVTNI